MQDQQTSINPVLSTIVDIGNGRIASVKGGLGYEVANALHGAFKKKIDPASGYVLESMQMDENTNAAIYTSVVGEKDYYEDTNKYYSVVYTVDPITISPVDLIDFKVAANETAHDDGQDADMVVYVERPHQELALSPAMESIEKICATNKIKLLYGMESLLNHFKGGSYD